MYIEAGASLCVEKCFQKFHVYLEAGDWHFKFFCQIRYNELQGKN
jgi:hypothetical protein